MPDNDATNDTDCATVGDVVKALEGLEAWIVALRDQLATLPANTQLAAPELVALSPPMTGNRGC